MSVFISAADSGKHVETVGQACKEAMEGRSDESDRLFERAWDSVCACARPRSEIDDMIGNWTRSLGMQERNDQALEVLDRYRTWCRETLGPGHPAEGTVVARRVEFLSPQEALPVLREAVRIWQASLGRLHDVVAYAQKALGHLLLELEVDKVPEMETAEESLDFWRALGREIDCTDWRGAFLKFGNSHNLLPAPDFDSPYIPTEETLDWDLHFFEPQAPESLKVLMDCDLSVYHLDCGELHSLPEPQAEPLRVASLVLPLWLPAADQSRFTGLKKLTFWGQADALPNWVLEQTDLNELVAPDKLKNFPAELCRLPLRKLVLQNCLVESFPAPLGDIITLEELTISGAPVSELPAFHNLQNLRELSLGNLPNLSRLPFDSWDGLGALEKLALSKLGPVKLPSGMDKMGCLRELVLDDTPLKELPGELKQMPSLESLSAVNCELQKLPPYGPPELKTLSLARNQLERLPRGWCVPTLVTLDLKGNHLSSLPQQFSSLKKLEKLDLWHNAFDQWPTEAEVPHLRELNLSQNLLSSIPESTRLPRLQSLHLASNRLVNVEPLAAMESLRNLSLQGNLIVQKPDAVLEALPNCRIKLENNPFQLSFTDPKLLGEHPSGHTVRYVVGRVSSYDDKGGVFREGGLTVSDIHFSVTPRQFRGPIPTGVGPSLAVNESYEVVLERERFFWRQLDDPGWRGNSLLGQEGVNSRFGAQVFLSARGSQLLIRGTPSSPSFLVELATNSISRIRLHRRGGNASGLLRQDAVSPDDESFLVATETGIARVQPGGKVRLLAGVKVPTSLIYHSDSRTVYVGDAEGRVHRFRWTGEALESLPPFDLKPPGSNWVIGGKSHRTRGTMHAGSVTALAIEPELGLLLSASGRVHPQSIHLWQLRDGKCLKALHESKEVSFLTRSSMKKWPQKLGVFGKVLWLISSNKKSETLTCWNWKTGAQLLWPPGDCRSIDVDESSGEVGYLSLDGEFRTVKLPQ